MAMKFVVTTLFAAMLAGCASVNEPRLDYSSFAKIVTNSSTKKEVADLLGPPRKTGRFDRQKRDWWEYRYRMMPDHRTVWLQFSDDGVVREMIDTLDPEEERKKDGPGSMP
jgi:hypothetical protein